MKTKHEMTKLELETWEIVVDGYCEACKGQISILMCDGECWRECDGFQEEFDGIMEDLIAEAASLTEPKRNGRPSP